MPYSLRLRRSEIRDMRRQRVPAVAPVVAEPPVEPAEPDYEDMKKDELIEVAQAQNLDTSGTKAEIIERLRG